MNSLGSLIEIKSSKIVKPKCRSERAELVGNLFEIYQADYSSRRKENWRRYVRYLKESHVRDSELERTKFKKNRTFIKELAISNFAFLLSHLSVSDLRYMISVSRDKLNRREPVSAFIIGSLKAR